MSEPIPQETVFIGATPVLASLDIARSVAFFCTQLGFESVHMAPGVYGIVGKGSVHIHFWACTERHIAQNTGCRLRVTGVDALFQRCQAAGIVHPNAPLSDQPWGSREFAVLDPDGNLVTFCEWPNDQGLPTQPAES